MTNGKIKKKKFTTFRPIELHFFFYLSIYSFIQNDQTIQLHNMFAVVTYYT